MEVILELRELWMPAQLGECTKQVSMTPLEPARTSMQRPERNPGLRVLG